jgi:hypothetical protein
METTMRARQHRPVVAVLVAVAMLAVAGCGGGDDESSTTTSDSSTTTSETADDGPTTLTKGEDVELVGEDGVAGQTLNITAEEESGVVTGEFRISENVITVQCAHTDTDGVVILGGAATAGPDVAVGDLLALIIREGDPDSVNISPNEGAQSCNELLESIPEDPATIPESDFVDVEDGSDIETG